MSGKLMDRAVSILNKLKCGVRSADVHEAVLVQHSTEGVNRSRYHPESLWLTFLCSYIYLGIRPEDLGSKTKSQLVIILETVSNLHLIEREKYIETVCEWLSLAINKMIIANGLEVNSRTFDTISSGASTIECQIRRFQRI